jgi:hypothetical protein
MNPSAAQTGQKRIEDLKLKEVDMIYSLARVGWTEPEIGRRYKISRDDVRQVIDNYVELRETLKRNQYSQQLARDPSPEATKKPRKRRSDAIFATPAERQAAYRARLKEKRNADMQVPSPDPVADSPPPVEEQFSVTAVDTP